MVRLFEVDRCVGDDGVSGDSAGYETVSDGASAETAGTVCTAGNFTGCVKARDRFLRSDVKHFGVLRDTDAAHAVVNFRPDAGRIERSLFNFNSESERTVELFVFAFTDVGVEFFNLLDQCFLRNTVSICKFSQRIELLDDAVLQTILQCLSLFDADAVGEANRVNGFPFSSSCLRMASERALRSASSLTKRLPVRLSTMMPFGKPAIVLN